MGRKPSEESRSTIAKDSTSSGSTQKKVEIRKISKKIQRKPKTSKVEKVEKSKKKDQKQENIKNKRKGNKKQAGKGSDYSDSEFTPPKLVPKKYVGFF